MEHDEIGEVIEAIQKHFSDRLSVWETEFLESVAEQHDAGRAVPAANGQVERDLRKGFARGARVRPGRKLGTVKMLGREIDVLDSLGNIDLNNLTEEVENAGGVATWWGEVSAITRRKANDLERQMDYIRADLRRKVRAGAIARMEKITVDAVDDEVTVHPQYQQAVKDYHEALEAAEKAESNKFISAHKQVQLQGYSSRVLAELAALGPPAGAPPLSTQRTAVKA